MTFLGAIRRGRMPNPVDGTTVPPDAPKVPESKLKNLSLKLALCRTLLVRVHPLLLIAAVAWIANFLHFKSFGYYEDDWYYYPTAFGQSFIARFKAILPFIIGFYQGRPGLLISLTVFAWADKHSTALPYILIYAVFTATALLFYGVLRMRFPRLFCAVAALFFVLSPLTTVRQNLVVEGIMGPAFICVLTAILIRRRHPVVAYLLAILAVFTYESVFLLFLAAPLFERGRLRGRKIRSIGVHLAVCVLILIGFVILRWAIGEERILTATATGTSALIRRAFTLFLSVPYFAGRSFLTYLYAIWVGWRERPLEPVIYLGGFYIWSLIVLRSSSLSVVTGTGKGSRLPAVRQTWWLWNGCIFSLGILAIGYLTIYFQNTGWMFFFAGRDTRFSASAVPGSSMFAASLIMLTALTVRQRFRWIVWALSVSLLSVLFVYSFVIQGDYVRAWAYQKNFFSQAVLLTPDLQMDGAIVVRTGLNPQPGFGPERRPGSIGWQRFGVVVSLKTMGAANHSDAIAKRAWLSAPDIVFVESDDWKDHIKGGPDGTLHWAPKVPGALSEFFIPGRLIVLNERDDGFLARSGEPVVVNGKSIGQPKPAANIAMGRSARQSSTYGQFYAFYGVDGCTTHSASVDNSAWKIVNASHLLQGFVSPPARTALSGLTTSPDGPGTYFHTNYEQNPWWEVDLERSFALQQVRIFNRRSAFLERAANLRLLLSDDDVAWRVAYENRGRVFGPAPLVIDLADVGARYVRIDLAKPGWLHLEQVEVYGR